MTPFTIADWLDDLLDYLAALPRRVIDAFHDWLEGIGKEAT